MRLLLFGNNKTFSLPTKPSDLYFSDGGPTALLIELICILKEMFLYNVGGKVNVNADILRKLQYNSMYSDDDDMVEFLRNK